MISFLHGTLLEKSPTRLVVDVHGVGYEVFIPVSSYDRLPAAGEAVQIQTYLHVREDAQVLYGFATQEEKSLFVLLISVSGIGPKSAIGIVSSITASEFRAAVASENLSAITALPGVGRKTAQRLILELKDKIHRLEGASESPPLTVSSSLTEEAVMAMVSLGYGKQIAEKSVGRAFQEIREPHPSLQLVIKTALRIASAG